MKKEEFDPAKKDAMDTHNLGEANFWFSAWIGAIFYYNILFRRKPFKYFNDEKYVKRNVITGWLLQMITIFGGLFLIFKILWRVCIF